MNDQKARRRVSTACTACRAKKTKCDGHPAQCSACRNRGQPCEYVYTDDKRKPPSKQHVRALEARVASLEKQLAAFRAHASPGSTAAHTQHAPSKVPMAPAHATDIDSVTDTLGSFNIGDGGEICYFGSRSNYNLLRCAQLNKPSSLEMQRRGYDATCHQIGLAFVAEDLESHLLHLFWTWQNPWQRVVARGPFLRDRAFRNGSPFGRFYSPALVSSIFALASRYSNRPDVRRDPQNPQTAGDVFAAQAKVMLLYECEAPTTTTVQALSLLALREIALDKEALGSMHIGMAVRMALSLGLHLDCSQCVEEGLLTAEEAEVRSVTWWGCYVLDKLFNIGLGRPSMILDCLMTVKMPTTDCEEEQQPWTASSTDAVGKSTPISYCVSNAIETCNMLVSVVEILDNTYSPGKDEKPSMASEAHVRLTSFYNSLPSILRISKSCKARALPHIYQLHLQYHVIMILLHRPFIKSRRTFAGTITGVSSDDHYIACRESAEWIAAILRNYKLHYGLRVIPISAVHCAFTAAVIFLLDSTSADERTYKKAMQHFKVCFDSLKDMELPWSWSTRSILALRKIALSWKVDISEIEPNSTPLAFHQPANTDSLSIADADDSIFGQFLEPLTDLPQETLSSALDWNTLYPFAEDSIISPFHDR